ncbi:MAG: glycerol-3-phosphate dehydrogenase [Pseudomonadota bacterium]
MFSPDVSLRKGGRVLSNRNSDKVLDVFVIGGGINGCGIARDAAGRGMSVALAEMNDLASATSSASTKLFHGGLRYLEYFEFRLVREALIEREVLLKAMPHISWPMRFVLPFHRDMRFESDTPTSRLLSIIMPWMKGRRPAWLIRLGLFLYDNLGGRKLLPGTATLDLAKAPEGTPLKDDFKTAYEYSDCWIEDSRLVSLNARDAQDRGAIIMTRTKVISAERNDGLWDITTEDVATGERSHWKARSLVNAGGPWVENVVRGVTRINSTEGVRLVRGSHIVTRKLFDHDKCYFFQGTDGRIIFAIPYENDFTLIGTTDAEHEDLSEKPYCTDEERDYLLAFASNYFAKPVTVDDIVWTFSGVRPLYDDGASSATAATRDYVLSLDTNGGAPVLNVFGGKITTYRRLAEGAVEKLQPLLGNTQEGWTAGVALAGGDFPVGGFDDLVNELAAKTPWLEVKTVKRLVRAYGTEAATIIGDAKSEKDLGVHFGSGLYQAEVKWLIEHEFARTAEDVLWRRSKLGLRFDDKAAETLRKWMEKNKPLENSELAA